ncbi:AtpZ/AtpI family protein [Rhodoligotrophos defluvii]|uniref:AtpZ/AtpI family protein n=1 Tax=Rhodoligotrophos defluvii TaxID=2561934 RepID=UPI001961BEC8|nr:AtpZ/AtpI family protein [Rhodoligotrophos defluvii]
MATEMAVAVAVGFACGWYLDKWLGTTPWMLLLFLPLGAAAGIMNVMRAARVEAERQQAELLRKDFEDQDRGGGNRPAPD